VAQCYDYLREAPNLRRHDIAIQVITLFKRLRFFQQLPTPTIFFLLREGQLQVQNRQGHHTGCTLAALYWKADGVLLESICTGPVPCAA
jgi:hypothetical protein